eukprot:GHUV01032645.1.p1 GENE.GHUV01032645.1~~GHUV01032645.1.p1  ORF type:complete len:143 (-),score=32.48 GHUV01032645.1:995-1423(-)
MAVLQQHSIELGSPKAARRKQKPDTGQQPRSRVGVTFTWLLKAFTALLVVLVCTSLGLILSSLTGEQLSAYHLHLTAAKETINRGWQRNFHRLAGVHWDIKHAAGLLPNETRSQLQPLWNYTFTMPQAQLQRSLVFIGPNHR